MSHYIQEFIDLVESGQLQASKEVHALIDHVKKCFAEEDIYVDEVQADKYFGLVKYFPWEEGILPWQKFVITLWLCTYWNHNPEDPDLDGEPRFPDLFLEVGRGAGKTGLIAFSSVCMASQYNTRVGRNYDVDIIANTESQALIAVNDIRNAFEQPKVEELLRGKYFEWTKEVVTALLTGAEIRARTNNPKSKDGLRTAAALFDEIHAYQDYENISVFTTGMGKKPHPRRGFFSSNGFVRTGPLDDFIEKSNKILFEDEPDRGWLPFICKLDDKDEIDDPQMWEKANPSLPYFKNLRLKIKEEYAVWKEAPSKNPHFLTKRFGIYDGIREFMVTSYENIQYTNRPIPDLRRSAAVAGIDFSKTTDWVSATILIKRGDLRYCLNHTWILDSENNVDLPLIKAPIRDWADMGLITFVEDKSINPRLVASWLQEQGQFYKIKKIAIDSYRYVVLSDALNQAGFGEKKIFEVRPSNIMKIQPVIDLCFANQYFVWGDNPVLRWATNNTKLVPAKKEYGGEIGNFVYGKVSPRNRKTDPFFSLAAAMCVEDELHTGSNPQALPKSITIVF